MAKAVVLWDEVTPDERPDRELVDAAMRSHGFPSADVHEIERLLVGGGCAAAVRASIRGIDIPACYAACQNRARRGDRFCGIHGGVDHRPPRQKWVVFWQSVPEEQRVTEEMLKARYKTYRDRNEEAHYVLTGGGCAAAVTAFERGLYGWSYYVPCSLSAVEGEELCLKHRGSRPIAPQPLRPEDKRSTDVQVRRYRRSLVAPSVERIWKSRVTRDLDGQCFVDEGVYLLRILGAIVARLVPKHGIDDLIADGHLAGFVVA